MRLYALIIFTATKDVNVGKSSLITRLYERLHGKRTAVRKFGTVLAGNFGSTLLYSKLQNVSKV